MCVCVCVCVCVTHTERNKHILRVFRAAILVNLRAPGSKTEFVSKDKLMVMEDTWPQPMISTSAHLYNHVRRCTTNKKGGGLISRSIIHVHSALCSLRFQCWGGRALHWGSQHLALAKSTLFSHSPELV